MPPGGCPRRTEGALKAGVTTSIGEGELPGDPAWLDRCRQRDHLAWSQYYERYHAFVRRSARRLGIPDAELDDVVQDTFTVAFKHLHRFEQGRMTTWLFRLVSNVASNRHRARRVREAFLAIFGAHRQQLGAAVAPDSDALEAQRQVQRLLSRLSPKKREVFALYELEGLKGEEIARLLDCELGTVWTRLHHARKDFERLARELEVTP